MIAVNGVLLNPRFGGITTYTTELLSEFENLISDDQLVIYCSKDQVGHYENRFRFRVRPTPLLSGNPVQRILRENFFWKGELRREGIKLFHSPISYIPFRLPVPSVVTLHDLRVFRFPRTYSKARMMFLRRAIRFSVKKADRIIAVSNFTKWELEELFGIPATKIRVIHEGINLERFQKTAENSDSEIVRKYGIRQPYILTVGHLEPRKNYDRLVEAFERAGKTLNESFQLVIVGRELLDYRRLYRSVRERGLNARVLFPGFVESSHLPAIYRNARGYVFPSIYEGFGFSPLESLASGVPVAASKGSSIPEILGNAALYFDPFSVDDMTEKMVTLIEDEGVREKIMDEAGAVLRRYNWRRCARETIALYQEILQDTIPAK